MEQVVLGQPVHLLTAIYSSSTVASATTKASFFMFEELSISFPFTVSL